jgi:hypothetical protein
MSESPSKIKLWFKRIGFAGFIFFLLKGIAWLVFFALVYFFGEESIPKGCR